MVVMVQYNILKIFTMHFNKINQTYYISYCSFIIMNERNLYKIFRNAILTQDNHIFMINSKKKNVETEFVNKLISICNQY